MSATHPIIAVTGSSGAGTTSVMRTFEQIFRRESVDAAFVEGDSFHRYDRAGDEAADGRGRRRAAISTSATSARTRTCSPSSRSCSASYGESGSGRRRKYLHDDAGGRAVSSRSPARSPTWEDAARRRPTCCSTRDCTARVVTSEIDVARHVDLLIGVVPVINLEWIQKLHRDRATRGYSTEAVTDTILRRMHDYVHYICPQFSRTHINFQRVPIVDTSNPFIARFIPTPDEIVPGDPLREPARHRLSLPAVDAARLVHVARRTRSCVPAARWTWRCSSSSRR